MGCEDTFILIGHKNQIIHFYFNLAILFKSIKQRITMKWPSKNQKYDLIADIIFLSILFVFSLICSPLFGFSYKYSDIIFTLILSFWGIFKLFFSGLKINNLSFFDLSLLLFVGYILFHFYLYSYTSIFYTKLWTYVGYYIVFYLFRWSLKSNNTSKKIHFVLLFILSNCFIQAIVGIFQRFGYFTVSHDFFTFLGSFTSPNFIGSYLGIGFVILIWYLAIHKVKTKVFFILGILGGILLGTAIILSNSRSTWIAISIALFVLFITSAKNWNQIIKIPLLKKTMLLCSIFIVCLVASKLLYNLKPDSANGRAFIFKIATQEIVKKPLIGHGLFSFAGGYNDAKVNYFTSENRSWDEIKIGSYVYTAFNDYVLVAYELGIPVLLFLIVIGLLVIFKTKITSETRIGLAIVLYLFVWGFFSSPTSNITLMTIGIFGFAILVNTVDFKIYKFRAPLNLTKITTVLLLMIGSFSIYLSVRKITSINMFNHHYSGPSQKTISKDDLIELSKLIDDNRYSDFKIGSLLYAKRHKQEGYAFMEKGYKKTSAPKIGIRLAQYYIRDGNYKRAKEIYNFNTHVEPYRYEARIHLLNLLKKINRHDEIIKISKEIVEFPVKLPSKTIDTYKKDAAKNIEYYTRKKNTYNTLKGSVSSIQIIESNLLDKKLQYKVYFPPLAKINKNLPVIYFNDGYRYINKGGALTILDSLIHKKIINPVVAVFLEPRDGYKKWATIRNELFLCNSKFVDFFTKEFIPAIENKYPVSKIRNDRTIVGYSFGGLAAAYLADQATGHFKNIAMQSPAFHPCQSIYDSFSEKPKKDLNIYISYGTGDDTEKQDLPMIEILENKGYPLKIKRVENGDHNWRVWKEQLDDIFIHFYEYN